ncbi:MAG: T9SS type A sorting domain-containing protein [Flavobacteriales bacterium]
MKFKLNINEPCHENWANMTPNEKGRFCDHCSKTVHDFTNHAPEEIAEVLKNGNGHVCGRVPNQFLNMEFAQAGYGKIGALALVGAAALSQGIQLPVEEFTKTENKNHIQVNVQNNYYKIAGSVTDASGNPVGGAVIQIMNGEKFVAQGFSLSTGNFALFLDKSKTFDGPLTIRIQKDGFMLSEETIIPSQTPDWKHDFVMEEEMVIGLVQPEVIQIEYATMGDMSYENHIIEPEYYEIREVSERVTGGAMICTYVKEEIAVTEKIETNTYQPKIEKVVVVFEDINKLNVFPNPASDQITLEFNRDKNYNAIIYDLAGKMIQQKQFTGNKLQMDVNELVPGNYIVYVVDTETQKSHSSKLVIVR